MKHHIDEVSEDSNLIEGINVENSQYRDKTIIDLNNAEEDVVFENIFFNNFTFILDDCSVDIKFKSCSFSDTFLEDHNFNISFDNCWFNISSGFTECEDIDFNNCYFFNTIEIFLDHCSLVKFNGCSIFKVEFNFDHSKIIMNECTYKNFVRCSVRSCNIVFKNPVFLNFYTPIVIENTYISLDGPSFNNIESDKIIKEIEDNEVNIKNSPTLNIWKI